MALAKAATIGITSPKTRVLLVVILLLTWWTALSIGRHGVHSTGYSFYSQDTRTKMSNGYEATYPRLFNASKLALIIEPKSKPHLVPLMLHMIAVVPPDWRFMFIGSSWSVHSVNTSKSIQHQQNIGKLEVITMPKPWRVDLHEHVSRLLTDVRFYIKFIPDAEWVFKFGDDSVLCANSASSLDDWLSWSWASSQRVNTNGGGGQIFDRGGLSLRRTSAVRRILSFQDRYNNSEPEDVWFAKHMTALPGENVASEFHGSISAEHAFKHKPIGYHVPERGKYLDYEVWKRKDLWKETLEYCPEVRMVLDIQWENECRNGGKAEAPSNIAPNSQQIRIPHVQEKHQEGDLVSPPQPPPFPLVHI